MMKRLLKRSAIALLVLVILVFLALGWYLHTKKVQRDGTVSLNGLSASVQVTYDERGVPHIQAQNQADLYRPLGYAHAQDRLFQMEMVRRLAGGELAEILGPKFIDMGRLCRTLGFRHFASHHALTRHTNSASSQPMIACLERINQSQ